MVTWSTLDARTGRVEVIECYPSLDDAIRDLALLAWEDPDPGAIDYVTSDQTGEVVATAMFSPELELFVTCSDGRRLAFEMPEGYPAGQRGVRDGGR